MSLLMTLFDSVVAGATIAAVADAADAAVAVDVAVSSEGCGTSMCNVNVQFESFLYIMW